MNKVQLLHKSLTEAVRAGDSAKAETLKGELKTVLAEEKREGEFDALVKSASEPVAAAADGKRVSLIIDAADAKDVELFLLQKSLEKDPVYAAVTKQNKELLAKMEEIQKSMSERRTVSQPTVAMGSERLTMDIVKSSHDIFTKSMEAQRKTFTASPSKAANVNMTMTALKLALQHALGAKE